MSGQGAVGGPRERELAAALEEQERGLRNCVHCGFCLPACPTYRRLGDEADSPRGRLYLMQAVVEGRLDADSSAFQSHIARCLGCRACEPVCPSGVQYGHVLELARQVGAEARRRPLLSRLLLRVFGTPSLCRLAMWVSRGLRRCGLAGLAVRITGLSRRLRGARLAAAMLAASAPDRTLVGPARALVRSQTSRDQPTVGVLAGCVQEGLFRRVNEATRRVLCANGYRVVDVPGQGCCGALHAHDGDLAGARTRAARNARAFDAAGVDFVALNASGCGAAMAQYGAWLAHDDALADVGARVGARVRDISWLLARAGPVPGGFLPWKIAYDPPCHLLHAQGVVHAPRQVLTSIPELELVPLEAAEECCGGAGIYGLTQPELGAWIGSDKVARVIEAEPMAVVSGNPGCMMQIGAGLILAGAKIPVLHLAEVLDESYRRGGLYGASAL